MDPGIHRTPAPGPGWFGAMDPGIHRAPAPVLAWLGAMDSGIQQGNRVWIRASIAASGWVADPPGGALGQHQAHQQHQANEHQVPANLSEES